jgi:hypothetical protein
LSSLLCFGRHTITGLLATCGLTFQDWSASFRLFSRQRFDAASTFRGIRAQVLGALAEKAPLCIAIDDTLLHKCGTKVAGVAWRRDPLGPAFHTNFVRAQRFLQFSAVLPTPAPLLTPHLIPIAALHTPGPPKLPKNASEPERKQHRLQARQQSLTARAAAEVLELSRQLAADPDQANRRIHILVDGGYTNKTLLRPLPANVTLIGRIRKDAKLHWLPQPAEHQPRGRRRRYGAVAPTPEQLRQDPAVPWQVVPVVATGKAHECRIKTMGPLLWRKAGVDRILRVVIIAPLAYRKTPTPSRPTGKVLYRQPAFLICTDPELPLPQIVQQYFWRWEIEVNFREQKTLLGVGQAQVRDPASCQNVPALIIAAYAVLLLAAARCGVEAGAPGLPLPKWRNRNASERVSTQRLLHRLRAETWSHTVGINTNRFSDFARGHRSRPKSQKFVPRLASALCYCNG